jgi:hypothetical protein
MNMLPLGAAALGVFLTYAVCYGVIEVAEKRGIPAPGTGWQVPQTFVVSQSSRRKVFTWGVLLGPGFATRNPYAGFGLLPLAVATPHDVVLGVVLAAGIGALHGTARGLVLLRDARRNEEADYMHTVLRSMYWRIFDGLALLTIASMVLAAGAYQL